MAARADGRGLDMAKKQKRPVRPAKATVVRTSRWTVRGVPGELQKAAGDAARARGMTLGQWLTELLDGATHGEPGASTSSWAAAIESRLDRLEAALMEPGTSAKPIPSDITARGP
jgi:hypothetical protein